MERYTIKTTIGIGEYFCVQQAVDNRKNKPVCLVQINTDCEEGAALHSKIVEQSNNNTVALFDQFKKGKLCCLVTEPFETNLAQEIKMRRICTVDVENIMFSLFLSIKSIQEKEEIHGAVFPNTCVKAGGKYKMSFFNNENVFKHDCSFELRNYQAPEILFASEDAYYSNDVWALGCVMTELYTGKTLFSGSNNKEILLKMVRILGSPAEQEFPKIRELEEMLDLEATLPSQLETVLKGIDPQAKELIQSILKWDCSKRPKATVCLKNAYFKGKNELLANSNFGRKRNISFSPRERRLLPPLKTASGKTMPKSSFTPSRASTRKNLTGEIKSNFVQFHTIDSRFGSKITEVKSNIMKLMRNQEKLEKQRKRARKYSTKKMFRDMTNQNESFSSSSEESSDSEKIELPIIKML